jgi:hypothetical protein
MALELTQPLTEMSTRAVKVGQFVGLTTITPSCADCLKICEPQTPGTLRASNGIALPLSLLEILFLINWKSWSISLREENPKENIRSHGRILNTEN